MHELRDLLQIIPNPAYFLDLESHRLLAVNHAFASLMQATEEELLRMTVEDLRPIEDLPALDKALRSSPPQGIVEWRYKRASGDIIFVRLSYRNSTYVDQEESRQREVRLVVISSWDTAPLLSSQEMFG